MVCVTTIIKTSDSDRERLRRQAAGADQGPTDEQQQGLRAYPWSDIVNEIGDSDDPANITFPLLRRIRKDHMVSMGLHFIQMPIVKAPWYIECDNAQVASFVDNLIRPIYGRLLLVLLRFLWSGYSPAVKNFEIVTDPGWMFSPGPGQDPKKVWDVPGVGAMVYKQVVPIRPENARPKWTSTGDFNGIGYDSRYGGAGYFIVNGQRSNDIDLLHSVWAVHDQEGEDGNPYGFPRIAYASPIYRAYRYIWTLLIRSFENNADPGPVVRFPQSDAAILSESGTKTSNAQTAIKIGRRKRSGSTIALPSDVYTDIQDKPTGVKKWDIEYPKNETDFTAIRQFLGFLEAGKLRALWIQEQGVIEGSGSTSNRNVASEFGDQRDASQIVLMKQLDDLIMDCFVKPALAMNMPWFEGSVEKKTLGFGDDDEAIVRQIFQLMGQSPEGFAHFGIDVRRLAEARGFPMLDHAAQAKLLQEAAAQASTNPPPAVTPTQGRRALVTQTGFDRASGQAEMTYVQLPTSIELATDADFISNLPRTDVYADQQVVAAARSLRKESKSFLSWLYDDFARYLGKQKALDIPEALAQEDGDELADRVRSVVDRLISGWRPKTERLDRFSSASRNILGRVFDRTVGVQFERVSSTVKLNSLDKDAAAWLDARGASLVSNALDTTRDQLARVLADGVREGKAQKQIAADVRDHFEGFPETRANTIVRSEIGPAYNYATVRAGIAAGIKMGQILDGNEDKPCRDRNGKIKKLIDLLKEQLNHPNCTLAIRLLPRAAANLAVVHTQLDGLLARYDEETATILIDPEIKPDEEMEWMIALGDALAQPQESSDAAQEAATV